MDSLVFLLSGTLLAGTPLLIAALGEMVVERTGVLNLSIEGMMALGAVVAFIVVTAGGGYWMALLAGGLAAAALSCVFAFVVLLCLGNQVATGIAIGIMGVGLSGLIGNSYESTTVPAMPELTIPILSNLPILGPGLFQNVSLVYMAPLLAVATWWVLTRTRLGLILRSVGEDPASANAIGLNVRLVRFLAILWGGLLSGIAGGFISIVMATLWADGLIAGRGWIVVALVVFGTWRAGRIAIGAYLFGLATLGGLLVQTLGLNVPSQLLTSVPYLVTILAITLLALNPARIFLNTPASLGQVYLQTR